MVVHWRVPGKKEWSHQTEAEIAQSADNEDFLLNLNICSIFYREQFLLLLSYEHRIYTNIVGVGNIYGKSVADLKNVTGF